MAWKARNPNAQPTDQGYATNLPNKVPTEARHSGVLTNPAGDTYFLWIENISMDFSMAGTTGQSAEKRTFFPHNFVQPNITVSGITANQRDHARLGEFIRETQLMAVGNQSWAPATGLTHLTVNSTRGVFPDTPGKVVSLPGASDNWELQGYIQNFGRGAVRFEFAKRYQLVFVIASASSPLLKDSNLAAQAMKSWTEVWPSSHGGSPFVEDPDKSIRPPGSANPTKSPSAGNASVVAINKIFSNIF